MTDDDEKHLVDKLRALKPRLPEDAKFWDDFTRDVRVGYGDRKRSRRRWLWLAPLPLAAVAALYLAVVPRDDAPAPAPDASRSEPARAVVPLPPPGDVDEIPDEDLDEILVELDGDEEEIDLEDLSDDELRRVYDALKGA